MLAALLSGLILMAQGGGVGDQAPVVLACQMPRPTAPGTPADAPTERIFRVAPGSLQEWDAAEKKFGANLCSAFTCVKAADRLEGNVSSASVSYTVGIATGTGQAYWRVVGASGFAARSGSCRVVAAPQATRP